jgi:hypothetical protein
LKGEGNPKGRSPSPLIDKEKTMTARWGWLTFFLLFLCAAILAEPKITQDVIYGHKVATDLVTLKGVDHGATAGPDFQEALKSIIGWFEKHLLTDSVAAQPHGADASASSGDGDLVAQLRALKLDRYLGIDPSSEGREGDWFTYAYEDSPAICLWGTPYRLAVRPGRGNSVVLYLQGGGAAWSDATRGMARATAEVGSIGGQIFDAENPDNPLRDWGAVFAPYCDGSVWSGDAEAAYEGQTAFHHGLQNLSAVLTQMRRHFPDPDRILVTGTSAGGYGTVLGTLMVRLVYPEVEHIYSLLDSGPGLWNPDRPEDSELRRKNWGLDRTLPLEDCSPCEQHLIHVLEWAMKLDPHLKAALYLSYYDPAGTTLIAPPPQLYALVREVTDPIHDAFPDRFMRFTNNDLHHVAITGRFHTTRVGDISLAQWVGWMISDDPRWGDWVEPLAEKSNPVLLAPRRVGAASE